MYVGTSGFAFLQHQQDGAQPILMMNSLHKSCEFFGDCDIPNHYNKTEIDNLLVNIDLSNYYTKAEIDSTLTNYTTDTQLHIDFYSKAKMNIILDTYYTKKETQTNYYNKTETDEIVSTIDLSNYYTKT